MKRVILRPVHAPGLRKQHKIMGTRKEIFLIRQKYVHNSNQNKSEWVSFSIKTLVSHILSPRSMFLFAQVAITKHHSLGGLNNRNLFLTILEAEKPKIKMLASRFHWRPLLSADRWSLSRYVLTRWRESASYGVSPSLRKIPIPWSHPHDFIYT